jgi:hypothetical protein
MNKYKEDYYILKNKDTEGIFTNKDDNYIQRKNKVQIYRFDDDTLAIQFYTKQFAKNRIKELSAIGIQLTPFQIGDNEITYTFSESDFSTVAEVVKAKKRIKRDLSDEQKETLKLRMQNMRDKMNRNKGLL